MVCLSSKNQATPLCLMCTLHMVIVLCLTVNTRGLHMAHAQGTVDMSPLEPTILAGDNFTLTCTIAQSSALVAEDIKWSRDGETLPAEWYSALDDKTSQLQIQKADCQDSGVYTCVAEKSLFDEGNSTHVFVGVSPRKAEDLSCFSRDSYNVTCKWDPGIDTNLNTTYTMQYQEILIFKSTDWENCGEDCECDDGKSCSLIVHETVKVRVVSSNKLGNATSAVVTFDHETQSVPYPPDSITAQPIPRSRLKITWDSLRNRQSPYYRSLKRYIHYKLEYNEEGSTVVIEYPNASVQIIGKDHVDLPKPDHLDAYTVYCVRVAAKFAEGPWSSWSDEVCNRTLEEPPDAELKANWSSEINPKNDSLRDVLLEWEPLPRANQRGEIRGYYVIETRPKENVTTLGPSQTSLKVSGLERYESYSFTIEAFNGAGNSPGTKLDITKEHPPVTSLAATVIIAILGVFFILGLFAFAWFCVKKFRLLKPVPNISLIALDRFEKVMGQPVRGGVSEREVFDELLGQPMPNGVIPNGNIGGNSHSRHSHHASQAAACVVEDPEEDYVKLRHQDRGEEMFPLLRSNSGEDSGTERGTACRKLSEVSTDSANSSGGSSERDVYSTDSTVASYGKCAKLYVQLPNLEPADSTHSSPSQFRLDSTDSGYGEHCPDCRFPSYSKLTTIPSDPSDNPDYESDNSAEDTYHRLANGEATASIFSLTEDQPNQPAYTEPRVPSYTTLSTIPGPGINEVAPSTDSQEHLSVSNGNVPNGMAPAFGDLEPGHM